MGRQKLSLIVGLSAVIAVGIIVGRAEQSIQETDGPKLKEAPAGFATPTLSVKPGSQSVSNGIPEPPNDTFALDQANVESRDEPLMLHEIQAIDARRAHAAIGIPQLSLTPRASGEDTRGTSLPDALLSFWVRASQAPTIASPSSARCKYCSRCGDSDQRYFFGNIYDGW